MTAVAMVNEAHAAGRSAPTDAELDALRNVCRCGTYPRVREAIAEGAAAMKVQQVKPRRKARKRKPRRRRTHRARHGTSG
jgi:isoquinoline 1-oxidoreductase alpha subunit